MKKGRTRFFSRRLSLLRVLFTVLVLGLLVFGVGAAWTVQTVRQDLEATLPSVEKLDQTEGRKITRILSSDGQLIATLFKENYKPVSHDELGENITNAVVAMEDRRFFEHDGVDYRGVARAAVGNAVAGEIEQGASTITMQLARHLYLSDERSYERKIREALLARKIEKEYSKQDILTRYLNEVYFGSGAHGIGAAASRYYGTTPEKLTVSQAAMLAGLIQSPTYLNPLTNHQGARHRQVQVLTAMRDQEYIDSTQYREAISEATQEDFRRASSGQPMLKYPYFSSFVANQLVQQQGEKAVYSGGLTVQTTLDRELQTKVQGILRDVIQREGGRYGVSSAAAVVIENKTGYIRSMVGGLQWRSGDQFNRAWQAERQPGSTFKPLLYASALELGYNQETILNDSAATYQIDQGNGTTKEWTPLNCDQTEKGKIPMREALRLSRNQATVDLLSRVGVSRLIDFADRAGITSELPRVPSLALGSGTVSPLEMAEAYTVFANDGVKREASTLAWVANSEGRRVSDNRHAWSYQATTPEVARQMTDMLRRVVTEGTGRAADITGLDVVGKTGTTDSFKDAWFVGYTPKYTICVWMGNDDNSPTYHLYGGSLPAVAWRQIAKSLDHQGAQRFDFLAAQPTKVKYCKVSNKKATPACKKTTVALYRTTPPSRPDCSQCEVKTVKQLAPGTVDLLNVSPAYPTVDTMEVTPEYPTAGRRPEFS